MKKRTPDQPQKGPSGLRIKTGGDPGVSGHIRSKSHSSHVHRGCIKTPTALADRNQVLQVVLALDGRVDRIRNHYGVSRTQPLRSPCDKGAPVVPAREPRSGNLHRRTPLDASVSQHAAFAPLRAHTYICVSSGRGSARDWNKSLAFQCLRPRVLKLQAKLLHADTAHKKGAS